MTNPVTERLLALAVEQTGMSRDEILAAIATFPNASQTRWVDCIDDDVKALWGSLAVEAKLVAIIHAVNLWQYQRPED